MDIRKEWVGLELPLAPGRTGVYERGVMGLFDRKAKQDTVIGYVVLVDDAIKALETKSAKAAAWWRTNASSLFSPGQGLVFQEYVCEPIES